MIPGPAIDDTTSGGIFLFFKQVAKPLKLVKDDEIRSDLFDCTGRQGVSEMRDEFNVLEILLIFESLQYRKQLLPFLKSEFFPH